MSSEINIYTSNEECNEWINKYSYFKSLNTNEDLNTIVENMLIDIFFVPNIGYTKDLYNENYNKSTLRLIHGFAFIYPLIQSYKKTKDKIYLNKCIDILENWMSKFRYNGKISCMSFHDETTALRLRNLIYLFDISKNILDISRVQIIYDEIKYTSDILSRDDFYSVNTNHGFFQDLSLIIYSEYFKFDTNSKTYMTIAQKRIRSYFEYIFTSDGVHKEHSPEYHFLIISNIKKILQSDLISDYDFYSYIESIYLKSVNFSTYIAKPNFELPHVGDTQREIYINKSYKDLYTDTNYKSLVNCEYKEIDLSLDYVFKEAGYAIFRNEWSMDAVYILLTAGYHTSYHKHCDDLSINIYYKGDIIFESGPFGYMYKDELCKYGYSGFAHNSLIVNNESLPRVDGKYEKVKIIDYKLEKNKACVRAINSRYDEAIHERILEFDKENLEINITDFITSENNNDYILLYHLGKYIKPLKEDNIIYLYKVDKLIGKITIKCDANIEINYSYGIDSEEIKGISFPEMYKVDYNYVIYINIKNIKLSSVKSIISIYR